MSLRGPERELTDFEADLVARYVEDGLGERDRTAFEERLLQDSALAAEVYRQQGIAAAVKTAGGARNGGRAIAPTRIGRRRWLRHPGLLAAAAVVIVAGAVMLNRSAPERLRSAGVTVRLIEPTGPTASTPTTFRWSAHPEAAQYRFELFDEAGNLAIARLVAETRLSLDRPGDPPVPERGSWRVVPLAADGRELPAPPAATYRPR